MVKGENKHMTKELVKDKEKSDYDRLQKRIDLMKEFTDSCDPRVVKAAREALGLTHKALREGTHNVDDILRLEVKATEYQERFIEECSCIKASKLVELEKKSIHPFR